MKLWDETLERGVALEEHRAICASSPQMARSLLRSYDALGYGAILFFTGIGFLLGALVGFSMPQQDAVPFAIWEGLALIISGFLATLVAGIWHDRLHRRIRSAAP